MSTKLSSRPKKSRQKDDMKQEIVAQVHKPTKRDASSDGDTQTTQHSEESSESNKNYLVEDKNENYSVHTPSRDVSVDGEAQINTKILNLIETEMRRDINKHSHFTDSRPQSLSFYEEEKIPEELSGNLELLSPEERKHYKRRKEHSQLDTDERNMYNSIQDIYSRDNDEIICGSGKKSKSRKKRHNDAEIGMGDSREMMIPKEKRKSKKKKRENSPVSASNKRKHRKRDEDNELKNEIAVALEELQDDVFENNIEDFIRHEKMKKSPRKSDKLYVQKKNRFEVSNRPNLTRSNTIDQDGYDKRSAESPIDTAIHIQKYWMPFTTFCHGLLGGLAFAHFAYLHCNRNSSDVQYIIHYANYSDLYTCMFYLLCVFCLISVFDRYDIASMTVSTFRDLFKKRKGCITLFLYATTMLIHLATARVDDKMSLVLYGNITELNISDSEVNEWYNLSLGRAIIAFISWIFISITPGEDLLYVHLKELV